MEYREAERRALQTEGKEGHSMRGHLVPDMSSVIWAYSTHILTGEAVCRCVLGITVGSPWRGEVLF